MSENEKEDENNFSSQYPLKFTYADFEYCRHQKCNVLVRAAIAASFVSLCLGNIFFFKTETEGNGLRLVLQLTLGEVQLGFGAI